MNDLIWVGNTLYPRWFAIAVPVALISVPFLVVGIASLVRRICR